MTGPDEVDVRPYWARWLSGVVAVAVLVVFVVVAVTMPGSDTGVHFTWSDQAAVLVIGVLAALGTLAPLVLRVRADADGVRVRNLLGTRRVAWAQVRRVSFPDGSPWARLDLPDDEYLGMVAIQVFDGQRAVTAMKALRRLHRQYGKQHQAQNEG